MHYKMVALSISALALLSTTAANAQVEQFAYSASTPNVLTYPAIMAGTGGLDACGASVGYGACDAGYGACGAPLFGRHTYYDNGLNYSRGGGLLGLGGGLLGLGGGLLGLGGGLLGLGGPAGYGVGPWAPGGYGAYGGYGAGVNTLSAVIPNSCGAAAGIAPVCGQRLSNSVFDVRLFRFGLGFGRVNPRWDARPAGSAL